MHKFGWKKNVGWGPMRETLAASILYKTGLLQHAHSLGTLKLWDPFCGSGTIPLVCLSMAKSLRIRQELTPNFVWQHWPIYNPKYLQDYLERSKQPNNTKMEIFGSDVDLSTVSSTVNNFKELISENK
jgi:23S rRNA G2445 N2-methylase RlmL